MLIIICVLAWSVFDLIKTAPLVSQTWYLMPSYAEFLEGHETDSPRVRLDYLLGKMTLWSCIGLHILTELCFFGFFLYLLVDMLHQNTDVYIVDADVYLLVILGYAAIHYLLSKSVAFLSGHHGIFIGDDEDKEDDLV